MAHQFKVAAITLNTATNVVPTAADLIREVHEAESSALASSRSGVWGKSI